jgi:uncharacterized glyoxalase superfamily protein PhnB
MLRRQSTSVLVLFNLQLLRKWRRVMPSMRLDAITVTSGDLAATAKVYSLLGFKFPQFEADAKHLEPITAAGDVRLMIDERGLMKSITGQAPKPPNHSSFAIKCGSPAEVDDGVAKIRAEGFLVMKAPWDAFWGQRYAIVADPDGYMVDLCSPHCERMRRRTLAYKIDCATRDGNCAQ